MAAKQQAKRKASSVSDPEAAARIRVLELRAENLEIDLDRKRGKLVATEHHERELTRVAAEIRAAVLELPSRLRASADAAGGSLTSAEVDRIASEACAAMLRKLSREK